MKTELLFLRRCLGETTAEDYVQWAVEQLCRDADTPSLRLLAGLNLTFERDEVEGFFLKSCSELELTAPKLDASVGETAAHLHAAYARGDLSARSLITALARLAHSFETHVSADDARDRRALEFWIDMGAQLRSSETDNGAGGDRYPTAALGRLDEAVQREWHLFERARRLELPPNFRHFVTCLSCGHTGPSGFRNPSFLRRVLQRSPLVRTACTACGSMELARMTDPRVRSEYLAKLECAANLDARA